MFGVVITEKGGAQRRLEFDKTEVTIYCIAPRGESAAARAHRIRQYEDFFNASGMATPDDLEEFRSCQIGYGARHAQWNAAASTIGERAVTVARFRSVTL